MADDNCNTSRFDKSALDMTRLEAFTMTAMHAILLGERGGKLSPEEVGENAAACAEAALSAASETLDDQDTEPS
ncbi:hypothetical protein [Halovibrio sp. HP20-50]|uniref:hypothetical protein n=1 Tax=Halovibrio sp. HP20-59 TaxID=3080275 RepID=UPI00294AF006|nr:hypothetical protein [Halovibrio sp. HP20-59]MEA2118797.1 hypothetical protein [Halovibrio sp. HP20-59]